MLNDGTKAHHFQHDAEPILTFHKIEVDMAFGSHCRMLLWQLQEENNKTSNLCESRKGNAGFLPTKAANLQNGIPYMEFASC